MSLTDRSHRQAERWARIYAIALIAVVMSVAGVLLLLLGDASDPLVSALGTTLISTGTLALAWNVLVERVQRTAVRDDIYKAVTSSWPDPTQGLIRAGIKTFRIEDVSEALSDCGTLRAVCLYDTNWTGDWRNPLLEFLKNSSSRADFILPATSNPALMESLAERHGMREVRDSTGTVTRSASDVMAGHIDTLAGHLMDINDLSSGTLTVSFLASRGPSYTSYLFEGKSGKGTGMMRTYGHNMNRVISQPEIIFREGGALWDHALSDWQSLRAQAT